MKFKLAFFLIFMIAVPCYASSDFMEEIKDLWYDNHPGDAFQRIFETAQGGENLDVINLVEFTGVRTIEKLVEGKGDEVAYMVQDKYLVMHGFTNSLRFADLEDGKVKTVFEPSIPLVDDRGLIVYKDVYVYYIQPKNGKFTVFEYDLKTKSSRPLGSIPDGQFMLKFSKENEILQFSGIDYEYMKTFNVFSRSEDPTADRITKRNPVKPVKVKVNPGHEKIQMEFNDESISFDYPRQEFLKAYNEGDTFELTKEHPDSILMRSGWYPGLHLLFDLGNKKAFKVYFPVFLDRADDISWSYYSGCLYIWKIRGEDAGLYRIRLNEYPDWYGLRKNLLDFKLVHEKSNRMESGKA